MMNRKSFCAIGPCNYSKHYMVLQDQQIQHVIRTQVEAGEYVVLERPPLSGKTTFLDRVCTKLESDFLVVRINAKENANLFSTNRSLAYGLSEALAQEIYKRDLVRAERMRAPLDMALPTCDLQERIALLCQETNFKPVLVVDDADAVKDKETFIDFLGILRNAFQMRVMRQESTFLSVIIASVGSITNLNLHPEERIRRNAPFNISSFMKADLDFSTGDVNKMLAEYSSRTEKDMDIDTVASALICLTGGQPFLTSMLCKTIMEEKLPWTTEGVKTACNRIEQAASHIPYFQMIRKVILDKPELLAFLEQMISLGNRPSFFAGHPATDIGVTYGILKENECQTVFANHMVEHYILQLMK